MAFVDDPDQEPQETDPNPKTHMFTLPTSYHADHADPVPPTTATRIYLVGDARGTPTEIGGLLAGMGHSVVGQTVSIDEALLQIPVARPDVVLMDVPLTEPGRMIDDATTIQTRLGIPVIFITAGTDRALIDRARLAQPYGMIVKPLKLVDVHAAVQMALYNHARNKDLQRERDMLHQRVSTGHSAPFFLKQGSRHIRLRLGDIRLVEALRDHVALHVKDQRYVANTTLRNMELRLPPDEFMRVHRSYIIRLDKIAAVQVSDIVLENDKRLIPIGETYLSIVLGRLNAR